MTASVARRRTTFRINIPGAIGLLVVVFWIVMLGGGTQRSARALSNWTLGKAQ